MHNHSTTKWRNEKRIICAKHNTNNASEKQTSGNDALAAVESLSCVSTVKAVVTEVEPAAVLAAVITSVSSLGYKRRPGPQLQDRLMSGNTAYVPPNTHKSLTYTEGKAQSEVWDHLFQSKPPKYSLTILANNDINGAFKMYPKSGRHEAIRKESEGVCEAANMSSDVDTSAFLQAKVPLVWS